MKRISLILVALLWSMPVMAQTGPQWTTYHAPVANTQATITQAAAANTAKQHVLDCIVAKITATAGAPAAATVNLLVRDGATGVGTILFQYPMSQQATAGASGDSIWTCGLNIVGTANTAMTVEFSAAGGANTLESVFIRGYDR